jgi:hypothetical protein
MSCRRSGLLLGATLFSTPGLGSGVSVGLLNLGIVIVLVLAPLLLYRRGHRPGPPDSDSGEGWGNGGPEPPRTPPDRPAGGIPLPDAEQTRIRLRGIGRLADKLPTRPRRPAREPDRRPAPEPERK